MPLHHSLLKTALFLNKAFGATGAKKMGRRTKMREKIFFGVMRRSAPPLGFLIAQAGNCAFMFISMRSLSSVQ